LTLWLQEVNESDPVIYPYWRDDRATVVTENVDGDIKAGVVLNQKVMLAVRSSKRLWFCDVPIEALVAATNAERSWFEE